MPKQEQTVHGYIAAAQRQGISQRETMRTLRESGFRFSDQTFRSAWGEIENARSLRGDIADVNIGRRPLEREQSDISGGKIGQYLYRFDFLLKRVGEREVLRTHVGVRTDKLVTYNDAAMRALERFIDNEDVYRSTVISWIPAAVNRFTG